jgi:hypothetical protein
MKVQAVALATILAASSASAQESCIHGSFELSFDGECNYENVFATFKAKIFNDDVNVPSGCLNTAEEEFQILLGFPKQPEEIQLAIRTICEGAWNTAPSVEFEKIAQAFDGQFEQNYYNGGTKWNEETETLYEDPLGERSNVLRRDAANVDLFYDNDAQNARVDWPDNGGILPNFDSCAHNAIFCCWTRDRQANDGNGNCDDPYDLECVDKDPADNTDLCYVDYSRSAQTTGYESAEGYSAFPADNNNGEGPIHCHGFAWSEDDGHPSARYAANNLFFISMYDHMTQRGYVENVPGAPMCACAEQVRATEAFCDAPSLTFISLLISFRVCALVTTFYTTIITDAGCITS